MTLGQQLREAIPDEAVDEQEIEEFIQQIENGESSLPVDMGLQVVVTPVPGDMWEDSHTHADLAGGSFVFHLNSEWASHFDAKCNEFIADWVEEEGENAL